MTQVDAVNTPASAADVLGALINSGVSQNAAIMLAAQSALETAGWTAMWNWNLGNITTSSGDYFILQGDQSHRYIPFGSLSSGSDYFVSYLSGHGLIPYADAGDLAGYVAKLKSFGYFESDASAYQAGMATWIQKLGGVTPSMGIPWKTIGVVAAILIGSAATAYYVLEGESPLKPVRRALAMENPRGSTEVQTLIFDRSEFTVAEAKRWAKDNGFKHSKVDVKPNTIRIRQHTPRGYRVFRTKRLTGGVQAVVAR